MLNKDLLKGLSSKCVYSIFLISASLDLSFLPAHTVFFFFFLFQKELFYCHLLQVFSCKVSVAGSMQQNTQHREDISREKKYYSSQPMLAENKGWDRGGQWYCVQLRNSQNNHLGNGIFSSHCPHLFFQTRTAANSTSHCAHVTGTFFPTPQAPWEIISLWNKNDIAYYSSNT